MDNQYLTVTALNNYLKYRFDNDVFLQNIMLEGQITSFKAHSSGHLYFSLKDDYTQISCVMFQREARQLNFIPKNGLKVYIRGRVSTYPASGTYQIYVSKMKDAGVGELFLQFEKLKKELNQLGYFSPEHKKPLPKFPKIIGVITSSTGAVIRDIIKTINKRYNNLEIIVYPTKVQGEGAKEEIAANIKKANSDALADVLILARGGGSMEDLWPFNERIVADAIYNSQIPLVSAVGHETDFTISDYVADLRSPTPTAAGTYVTPEKESLVNQISSLLKLLNSSYRKHLDDFTMQVLNLETRLKNAAPSTKLNQQKQLVEHYLRQLKLLYQQRLYEKQSSLQLLRNELSKNEPQKVIAYKKEYLKSIYNKLEHAFKNNMDAKKQAYLLLNTKLETLNPLGIMAKGFSLASIDNHYIRSVSEVKVGDKISTEVKDGKIISQVMEVKNA